MKKLRTILMVILLVLLTCSPAAASQENEITITATIYFTGTSEIPDGIFTAEGAAVDEGLFCPSGSVTTPWQVMAGPPNWDRQNFTGRHVFNCDDGSGTITFGYQAQVIFSPDYENVGRWNVLKGTGAYARLHGTGSMANTQITNEEGENLGVIDTYEGWLNK